MSSESLIRSVLEAYVLVSYRENIAEYFKRLSDVALFIKQLYAG